MLVPQSLLALAELAVRHRSIPPPCDPSRSCGFWCAFHVRWRMMDL